MARFSSKIINCFSFIYYIHSLSTEAVGLNFNFKLRHQSRLAERYFFPDYPKYSLEEVNQSFWQYT